MNEWVFEYGTINSTVTVDNYKDYNGQLLTRLSRRVYRVTRRRVYRVNYLQDEIGESSCQQAAK